MNEQVLDDFMVGDALSISFSTFFRNFLPFSLMSMIVYLPFFLLNLYIFGVDPTAVPEFDFNYLYWTFGLLGLYLVFIYLAYGAITFGTIRDLQGNRASFGEILAVGFARFIPVLLVAIVTTIAILIGLIFLVIPGVIIGLMVYVAIPVAVIEKPGIFESLSRSAQLTKGYKGKIFGLGIVVGLISWGINIVLQIFVLINPILYSIIDLILNSAYIAFGAVVVSVVYQELRRVKEGADIDTIASVFS